MTYLPLKQRLDDPSFDASVVRLTLKVRESTDEGEVIATIGKMAALFAADCAAFIAFVKDDEAFDSYRTLLACDPRWRDEYENMSGHLDDPWLDHVRRSSEARLTQQLAPKSARQAAVVALAKRFSFSSGLVVPVHGPQGLTRLGAFFMGSRREDHFDETTLQHTAFHARGFAERLNSWQFAQLRRELLAGTALSAQEVALLEHERSGLGTKEVAELLQLSRPSINSRWQRLIAKLGVPSRAEAARVAADYGLI